MSPLALLAMLLAVALLFHFSERLQRQRERRREAREAHEHERAVRLYRAAIKDLLARATDPQRLPALFYRREVYRHISNMSHRADLAANVLRMVMMKLA